jgi:hypothetical protein
MRSFTQSLFNSFPTIVGIIAVSCMIPLSADPNPKSIELLVQQKEVDDFRKELEMVLNWASESTKEREPFANALVELSTNEAKKLLADSESRRAFDERGSDLARRLLDKREAMERRAVEFGVATQADLAESLYAQPGELRGITVKQLNDFRVKLVKLRDRERRVRFNLGIVSGFFSLNNLHANLVERRMRQMIKEARKAHSLANDDTSQSSYEERLAKAAQKLRLQTSATWNQSLDEIELWIKGKTNSRPKFYLNLAPHERQIFDTLDELRFRNGEMIEELGRAEEDGLMRRFLVKFLVSAGSACDRLFARAPF